MILYDVSALARAGRVELAVGELSESGAVSICARIDPDRADAIAAEISRAAAVARAGGEEQLSLPSFLDILAG